MFQCDKCNVELPADFDEWNDMFISENHVYCPECTDELFGNKKRKSRFALWAEHVESSAGAK
ncbi:MAG: hypothetical protein OXE97_02935 [Gammaproteobacteria bacterium]|nr:hypothetical protein [Gammaproteobacteria bacterium]